MSNVSKRRREGSRPKIKFSLLPALPECNPFIFLSSQPSMGDHNEFLKRITKTLYYGELPEIPCLSLPVTEVSCALWSAAQQGRSLRRLHCDAAARLARGACVSPCALVLALLYLERLRHRNPDYLAATAPADLFLVSLMIGNKFLQDDGEDDEVVCAEWAASGGLPLRELKKLEIQFLDAIDWNVYVDNESFESGLTWLERRVALKQAAARGFFTYGDLAAAGAQAGEVAALAAAAAALAVAYVAAVTALLASAFIVSSVSVPLHHLARSRLTFDEVAPPAYLPNATIDFQIPPVECCPAWTKYRETVEPKLRSDGLAWSFEPWWSKSVLTWLYRSSLDPMRRWIEKLDEYADLGKTREPRTRCEHEPPRCMRQWLNLSRLGGLAVVSDR